LAQLHHAHDRAHLLASFAKMAKILLQAGVMVLGAVMILDHRTTPGSLMGANLLLNKLLGPFDALVGSWRHWVLSLSAWRRIRSIATGPELSPSEQALSPDSTHSIDAPGLVLSQMSYCLPVQGRVLLRNVNLTLLPGQLVGVVGPNGAGKSTLLRLLVGLLAPTEGSIHLDGTSLAASDRRRIGYLPQNVGLLDGTVAENIRRFAESGDVIGPARQAGVHELIGRLPRGYDAELRPGAHALSGGQLQRVGLARALFGDPRLLVLDEPDASLDHEGEVALRSALLAARDRGCIVVLTTHRQGLLAAMDQLLEVQDGHVVAVAPPATGAADMREMKVQPA
jgi:ATP-binding cassette subfamily C protein